MTPPSRGMQRRLALLLGALWMGCALGTAVTIARHTGVPPLFVAAPAGADGFPEVIAFQGHLTGGAVGELRIGDRLLRIGNVDLRGVGPLVFFAAFVEQARHGQPVGTEFERDGRRVTTTILPASTELFLPLLAASVVFAVVTFVLWTRASGDPSARAFVLSFIPLAFFLAGNFFGSRPATYATMALHALTMTLVGPLTLRAWLRFPASAATARSSARWPWLFAVLGLLHTAHFGGPVPPAFGIPAAALVVVALLVASLLVITSRYRRADLLGRRRIKWALFGAYCAAMPPIICGLLTGIDPAFGSLYSASLTAIACLPISLLIAIVRVNLFDIDRLISSAGSYNLLLALAVTIGVTVVPRAAEAGADLLGVAPLVGQIGLSIPLALFVLHAHRRLRPRIDRLFFAERYALDTGVHALIGELRQASDVQALVQRMAQGLIRLVRPESCVVYARVDDAYTVFFADGRVVPPALAADGPLLATLRGRHEPLALNRTEWRADAALDPFERAVLETLGCAVVVPIWRAGSVALLICLGAKRSGDVYTATDIGLLATLGASVSAQLDHFEQSETIRQTRLMRDTLRRYIPAPLADALGGGADLAPAEREVTVLFVDLRGYTALCEPLPPNEVFDLTSRFTETLSEVIRHHEGTLVEFSGDGLMAIFGAPVDLPQKEAAAVRAAREVTIALSARGPTAPDGRPLRVGVGIATGVALCGNIRSADQVIWTAVGNIVNLAARLQSLTREIDAVIAIDVATYRAAGFVAADFRRRENVAIRGRSEPEDIYVLPLSPEAAAA